MAKLGGSASTEIDAPLDAVWAVVEDVLSAPEWQNGLVAMTALETDAEGRPPLLEVENDIKVRTGRARLRSASDAPARLAWSQEKGDGKSGSGWWQRGDLGGDRPEATY